MKKQLKFDHKYVDSIINRNRTSTIRIDDRGLKVGDSIQLVDKKTADTPQEWEIPGELHIESVQSFRLGTIPLEALKNSELSSTENRESLTKILRRFYGDRVDDMTIVSVVGFSYTPYNEPVKYLEFEQINERVEIADLYADGGSRGNPGPSAAGFVVQDKQGRVIKSWNKYLGITTNNQAEYHACVEGMDWCLRHGIHSVHVYLDSMLVVNQLKGVYKVKNRDLWTLYETARKLQSSFKMFEVTHVPRELNKKADKQVNIALDAVKGEDIVQ
jgi:ribonuclease HI